MNTSRLLIFLLVTALILSLFWNFNLTIRVRELEGGEFPLVPPLAEEINSFEDCAAAGYPIMESYPERCATPEGKSFTRDISAEEPVQAE